MVIVLFAHSLGRSNPPEYLAATGEPAESASEEVSPLDEPFAPIRGWSLAQYSTEPFFCAIPS
jgi:hypothetical protein